MNHNDIIEHYELKNTLQEDYQDEDIGTINGEGKDISRKIKALENKFDITYIKLNDIIDILFNGFIPIILGFYSIIALYDFLDCIK